MTTVMAMGYRAADPQAGRTKAAPDGSGPATTENYPYLCEILSLS